MTDPLVQQLAANIAAVRGRIDQAAKKAGRRGDEITLIAVTKYVNESVTAAAIEAGCRDLGESRPQDLWRKAEVVQHPDLRWHMIGHVQRNKVRRSLPLVSLIHSGDSLRLLREINEHAASLDLQIPILLEVNVSGDRTKHGFRVDESSEALAEASQLSRLRIEGLMAMASREGDLSRARQEFRELRQLRDRLQAAYPNVSLAQLSMGMSGDFEVAIEEGATMIRVGSSLFTGIAT